MASGPLIANGAAPASLAPGAAAAPAESEQLPSHLPDLGLRDYAGSELAQELRERVVRRAELAGRRARIAELPVDQLWEIPCRCARGLRCRVPPVLTAAPTARAHARATAHAAAAPPPSLSTRRPLTIFSVRDYSRPSPHEGRRRARDEVPFLFKAFESGQSPPPRPGTRRAELPRAATIHEYLDWTVTANAPESPEDLVR
jgi:hypothetical protein